MAIVKAVRNVFGASEKPRPYPAQFGGEAGRRSDITLYLEESHRFKAWAQGCRRLRGSKGEVRSGKGRGA